MTVWYLLLSSGVDVPDSFLLGMYPVGNGVDVAFAFVIPHLSKTVRK